jgi:hypothetical protein
MRDQRAAINSQRISLIASRFSLSPIASSRCADAREAPGNQRIQRIMATYSVN